MQYKSLPQVGSHELPELSYRRSPNQSGRGQHRPSLVVVHTWGGGNYQGVIEWLCKEGENGSDASAHIVYGGVGHATQLVMWGRKAWTQCHLNPVAISVESADAIWQGHYPEGFAQLARIVAFLCKEHLGVCRYVDGSGILHGMRGFTRHADAGALGCGHLYCPTHDAELWGQFEHRVVSEYQHGGFRKDWGR